MTFLTALSTVILMLLVLFLMLGAAELVSQALLPVTVALEGK